MEKNMLKFGMLDIFTVIVFLSSAFNVDSVMTYRRHSLDTNNQPIQHDLFYDYL